MDVTPLVAAGQQVIRSYGRGRFVITGVTYSHPVIVFPDRVMRWDFSGHADALSAKDFSFISGDGENDILLVGCGGVGAFLPELRKQLKASGINADFMDTGAACRTYNVLMAEGRRVAAALIPL